ncbi:unnamed protein product [Meganyctiphanes norvegica]|uniref:Uncharacterized protein n=1 Tax=Meganyctiphanes norvegica TaxID=48144 RepID=A0AAV2RQ79_MEGNR
MSFSVFILHDSSPFIAACPSNPLYQQFDVFSFTKPQATYLASIQQFPLPRSFKVSTMNQSFYHTYYHALGLSAHISCCFQYILLCTKVTVITSVIYFLAPPATHNQYTQQPADYVLASTQQPADYVLALMLPPSKTLFVLPKEPNVCDGPPSTAFGLSSNCILFFGGLPPKDCNVSKSIASGLLIQITLSLVNIPYFWPLSWGVATQRLQYFKVHFI